MAVSFKIDPLKVLPPKNGLFKGYNFLSTHQIWTLLTINNRNTYWYTLFHIQKYTLILCQWTRDKGIHCIGFLSV